MAHNDPTGDDTRDCPNPPEYVAPASRLAILWRDGPPPDLDAFLGREGNLTPPQLVAVLRVDQRERWRLGRRVPAETYLERFPRAGESEEGAIDLAYGEYLLRGRDGEPPRLDEFLARFPAIAPALKSQIEFHLALQAAARPEPDDGAANDPNVETQAHGGDTRSESGVPLVPGYEILSELGRGGMGVVYRARHLKLKRLVALKMLIAGAHASPQERARFRTEAESAARLQHPNIVQVHEVGEAEGRPFLVMELIDGGSLKGLLDGVPRPERWSAELLRTLATAVHFAHTQGVVHRDLKPANILVGADPVPVVKITDFGLAKQFGIQATHPDATRTGDILGTPSYMSPEQAVGKSGEIGPATDVYALGSILYELLTGRPPFQAETPFRTLQQVATEDPVSPSQLQRRLPRDLVTICLKCLRKEPRKRYATAAALADDLGRFLAGESILARPVGYAERGLRWVWRNPRLTALFALVVALLVVIAVGSFVSALRLRNSADESERHAKLADENASERLWEKKLADARAARFSNQAGRRFIGAAALAEAAQIRQAPELRDEAIAGMALHDLRPAKSWPFATGNRIGFAFTPDFQTFAAWDLSGEYSVRRVADNRELHRVRGLSDGDFVRFSPDGRYLAVCSQRTKRVEVWDVSGHKPALVARPADIFATPDFAAEFSPDSRHLFTGHLDGVIRQYDLDGGRITEVIRLGFLPTFLAAHPTRRQLAVAHGTVIQIRDTDTGKLLVELGQEKTPDWLAWHPSGEYLAVACGSEVALWNADERRRVSAMSASAPGLIIKFGRSGDCLCGIDWNYSLFVWEPWTGKVLFCTPVLDHCWWGFDADDQLRVVQATGGQLRISELVRSPTYTTLPNRGLPAHDHMRFVSLCHAGRGAGRLLAVGSDHGVALVDLESRTGVGHLSIRSTPCAVFDSTGALWTNGVDGVLRWPVADEPGGGLRFGPPERCRQFGTGCQVACSDDGEVVAVACHDGAELIRRDRPGKPIRLGPHTEARYVAVSPSGQWVATGSHGPHGVKIWDAADGRLVRELPLGPVLATVAFSPDGQWLLTAVGAGDFLLWRCGTWEAGSKLGKTNQSAPTHAAFSRNGKVAALYAGGGAIRVVETESGREHARFQGPFPSLFSYLAYSSESGRFVTHDGTSVHVWNLGPVRTELAALGVACDLPAVPPKPAPARLKVNVVGPDTAAELRQHLDVCDRELAKTPDSAAYLGGRARVLTELRRYEAAARDLDRAIELQPTSTLYSDRAAVRQHLGRHAESIADLQNALCHRLPTETEALLRNNLAWALLMGPDEVRDPDAAVAIAAHAIRLAPHEPNYANTLGVAYYRLRRYGEAIPHLRRSLREADSPAHDLFFLAMCYRRLDDRAKGQDYYDQACYWMSRHAEKLPPHLRTELQEIRREAQLLGLK